MFIAMNRVQTIAGEEQAFGRANGSAGDNRPPDIGRPRSGNLRAVQSARSS